MQTKCIHQKQRYCIRSQSIYVDISSVRIFRVGNCVDITLCAISAGANNPRNIWMYVWLCVKAKKINIVQSKRTQTQSETDEINLRCRSVAQIWGSAGCVCVEFRTLFEDTHSYMEFGGADMVRELRIRESQLERASEWRLCMRGGPVFRVLLMLWRLIDGDVDAEWLLSTTINNNNNNNNKNPRTKNQPVFSAFGLSEREREFRVWRTDSLGPRQGLIAHRFTLSLPRCCWWKVAGFSITNAKAFFLGILLSKLRARSKSHTERTICLQLSVWLTRFARPKPPHPHTPPPLHHPIPSRLIVWIW